MKKIDSVISLLLSLSKSEKKQFVLQTSGGNEEKDYLILYHLIVKRNIQDTVLIKKEFCKLKPTGSFEIAVHYLYEKILDSLLSLRKRKDLHYDLFQKISKARMLYDRSSFYECFELLSEVSETAKKYEYYEILLISTKLELEYLLRLNFLSVSEEELYHKHYLQVNAIKNIRKITEQSSLYDTLKYRLIYKGDIRTPKQKQDMNDLMVSELYIAASSEGESNFEIKKNHQLFQANYLMGVGDFESAIRTLKELNKLFEQNPQFWANPPIYYMSVLEGILNSLRHAGNYDEMTYFTGKLKTLSESSSVEFGVNATCLIFQYELFPWLDKGDFKQCEEIIQRYKTSLFDKENWLNHVRKCELSLYISIVYIGLKNYSKARKLINSIMIDRSLDYLPIMRMIRLIRLITYYETGDFELIRSETRSIKRGLTHKKELFFQTEHTLLWFLNKEHLPVLNKDKELLWKKLSSKFEQFQHDRFESQILRIFDFSAWMEARIFKKNLSAVLEEHFLIKIRDKTKSDS